MTGRGKTEKLNWPRWQQVLLIALLAVLIGNRMTMLVDTVVVPSGIAGEQAGAGGGGDYLSRSTNQTRLSPGQRGSSRQPHGKSRCQGRRLFAL